MIFFLEKIRQFDIYMMYSNNKITIGKNGGGQRFIDMPQYTFYLKIIPLQVSPILVS